MKTVFTGAILNTHVLLALSLLAGNQAALAACVDDGAGTINCSGTSTNTDAALVGQVVLDNAAAPVELNNIGTDPTLITIPDSGNGPTLGAIIQNTANTVGPANLINLTGGNPVVINNIGAKLFLDGSSRNIDPAAWSNDAIGQLYNNGVLVGIAAAISAGPQVTSLTVNNQTVDNGVFYPDPYYINGVPAQISASGAYSAAISTSAPLFTFNNAGIVFGKVSTYAGASYTPPALLDGTRYATVNSAGMTVINMPNYNGAIIGDIEVVDRNPLLTQAQAADPSLVLAYGPNDVGPRNSQITFNNGASMYGNIHLGSGAHTINISGDYSAINGNIYVDQRDSEVVSVVSGVASTLYKVHGDRTFNFNYSGLTGAPGIKDIVINDVAGAVNNVSVSFGASNYFPNNFTANGLGSNTLNLTYQGQLGQADGFSNAGTYHSGIINGFNTLNLNGGTMSLIGQYNILGDININAGYIVLPGDWFGITTNLNADNVVVNAGASLITSTAFNSYHNKIGDITGNLINNGFIFLGDARLDVNGNVNLNSGSVVRIDAGQASMGQINASGITTIASDAVIIPRVKDNVIVHNGDSYVIATNATGLPTIDNQRSMLQWVADLSTGNLTLTADIGVPDYLKSQVSRAGSNAVDALFNATGSPAGDDTLSALQTTLIQPDISDKTLIRAAERLRPEINDGSMRMLLGNSDKLFSQIDARLLDANYSKSAPDESIVVGDKAPLPSNKGLWVQGFGDRGTQETRKGVDGYGLSSVGMAVGMDKILDTREFTRVGVAGGYARSNASNNGYTVNNRIDMNSFMGAAYASRTWDSWYLNGTLGLARHTYETRRQLFDYASTGQHDSWQFSSRLDAGFPIQIDEAFTFIPMLSLNYSHIKESGFKEKGLFSRPLYDKSVAPTFPLVINGVSQFVLDSSPTNLAVEGRSFDSIRAGIGGKGIYTIQEPNWAAELELHGMLIREFGDLAQDSKARFLAGGPSFASPGVPLARDTILLGGRVNLSSADENDQLSLIASYDAEMRSKYFGQTVSLMARYDFDQAPRYLKTAATRSAAAKARQSQQQLVTATDKDIHDMRQSLQPALTDQAEADAPTVQAIDKAIYNWVTALSNKNLDVYFNSYAANFISPEGNNRQQWERKRKAEIAKLPNAMVKVSYLTIKPNGDKAMAVFTETSSVSDAPKTLQKIVDLENRNGRWLIVREDSIALTK